MEALLTSTPYQPLVTMVEENTLPKVKRICVECGSDKTYTQLSRGKWFQENWYDGEKYGRDGWLCGKCNRRLRRQQGFEKQDQRHSLLSPEKLQKKLEYNRQYLHEYREVKGDKWDEQRRLYTIQLKTRLMQILGQDACVYCGCQLFPCLQFDHINSGGTRDAKRFGNQSIRMKQYYIKHPEEARKTLQVLCANCNWLKRWRNGEDATLVLVSDIT